MDTSKEYIKMCEKAVEIQKLRRKFHWGDYFWSTIGWTNQWGGGQALGLLLIDNHRDKRYEGSIWLPRQDQLQEMILQNESYCPKISMLMNTMFAQAGLGHWMILPNYAYIKSMEQLWLAFVMKEKYQKTWDGKEWITQ